MIDCEYVYHEDPETSRYRAAIWRRGGGWCWQLERLLDGSAATWLACVGAPRVDGAEKSKKRAEEVALAAVLAARHLERGDELATDL